MHPEITYYYENPLIQNKTEEEIKETTEIILTKLDNKEELTIDEMHFFYKNIGTVYETKKRCYGQFDDAEYIIKRLRRGKFNTDQFYEVHYIYVNHQYSHRYDFEYVKPVYPVEFQTVVTYREWKFKD